MDTLTRAWTFQHLWPFLARPLHRVRAEARFAELTDRHPSVFTIRLSGGTATLRAKPRASAAHQAQAEAYRAHLEAAAQLFCPDEDATLCLAVDGSPLPDTDVPVLGWTRAQGTRAVLLPAPLLIAPAWAVPDPALTYEATRIHARMEGAIADGRIAGEALRRRTLKRIDAAHALSGDPDVTVRLRAGAEFETEAARRFALNLPFVAAEPDPPQRSPERFVIAIDGAGDYASLLISGLVSSSALLAYPFTTEVHFTAGLLPFVHYAPVGEHSQVKDFIALERRTPGIFAPVASGGRDFAAAHFTPDAILAYTGALLRLYPRCFQSAGASSGAAAGAEPGVLTIVAHIQRQGDIRVDGETWAGAPGSGCCVEGFAIGAGPKADPALSVSYSAILPDGTASPWFADGGFCGSRGRSAPLAGLRVRLDGPLAATWHLGVEAVFTDGSAAGPAGAGESCASPTGAPLEAFRLLLSRPG